MLVYANNLMFQGGGAEEAIFKAIGGWLKEQLGYGLHPAKLRQDGEYEGSRGNARSWLQVRATDEIEPKLYAWVLKNTDETVHGRQWISEIGLKILHGTLELSCIVKTDELSTLVDAPVIASRPRFIPYVVRNIKSANNAAFVASIPGVGIKTIGQERTSYRGLLAEIGRRERDYPIVLVSPTHGGVYLVDAARLQEDLIGLAQVVEIAPEFNSYEMAEVLGQPWSAWGGAVNVLNAPTQSGFVRARFFLSATIEGWGETQTARISQLLAWVTGSTNIVHLHRRIRPEGIAQLALRRRLQSAQAHSDQLGISQLRRELEKASRLSQKDAEWIDELEKDNARLDAARKDIEATLSDTKDEIGKRNYAIQSLKDQLANSGTGRTSDLDAERLLRLACRADSPPPLECLEVIADIYGDECLLLDSALDSARNMNHFARGRQLLDLLRRLVTEYRSQLIEGGDSKARLVFGKDEYAAKESETVTASKAMLRARTFDYNGAPVQMLRHLKIGVADDVTKTIRVHFHWDAERTKIVIGYCGQHLPVASYGSSRNRVGELRG